MGDERQDPDTVGAAAADASLRKWITTGRAPRRAHLVGWLLQRLEIVRVAAGEGGNSDGASEDQQSGRFHGGGSSARWSLVISKDTVNIDSTIDKGGTADNKTRRRQSGCADEGREGVNTVSPHTRTLSGAAASSTITMPQVGARDLTEGGGRGEGDGIGENQWRWWDEENPWSRGSRSSTKDSKSPADRRLSGHLPPPAYQETAPPPPYQEVVANNSDLRPSTQKTVLKRYHHTEPPEMAAATNSALSDGASSSGDDTSRGEPPSYGTAAAGRAGRVFASRSEEKQQQPLIQDLPPPSYGRFYGDGHPATVVSPPHRESSSNSKSSSATSDTAEWWARDDVGDDSHHRHQRQSRPKTGRDREQERVRERGHGRRRRHVSADGGSFDGLQAFDGKTVQRPETTVGDNDKEKEMLGGAWGWRSRYGDGGRRSPTAAGVSRPRTTLPLSRGKNGRKDTTMR